MIKNTIKEQQPATLRYHSTETFDRISDSANGYNVYVGAIRDKEVDFVAIKGDRAIYIQATYMLIAKQTVEREYSSLEAINDSFEKIVVSLDDIAQPSRDGIGIFNHGSSLIYCKKITNNMLERSEYDREYKTLAFFK